MAFLILLLVATWVMVWIGLRSADSCDGQRLPMIAPGPPGRSSIVVRAGPSVTT